MRKRQFDITGKKFGELYVVKRDHLSNKGWYWFCNCSCNKTTIVRIDHLTGGRIKSCGCKLKGKTSVHWKGYEKISGAEWGSIKEGAIDRHLLLEISIKDIWNQFEKQNGKCALTNLDIDFNRGKHSKNVYLGSASLDRINNAAAPPSSIEEIALAKATSKQIPTPIKLLSIFKTSLRPDIRPLSKMGTVWTFCVWPINFPFTI